MAAASEVAAASAARGPAGAESGAATAPAAVMPAAWRSRRGMAAPSGGAAAARMAPASRLRCGVRWAGPGSRRSAWTDRLSRRAARPRNRPWRRISGTALYSCRAPSRNAISPPAVCRASSPPPFASWLLHRTRADRYGCRQCWPRSVTRGPASCARCTGPTCSGTAAGRQTSSRHEPASGPVAGGAVMLDHLRDGAPLVIGEGIETALSAAAVIGGAAWVGDLRWQPRIPAVAAAIGLPGGGDRRRSRPRGRARRRRCRAPLAR